MPAILFKSYNGKRHVFRSYCGRYGLVRQHGAWTLLERHAGLTYRTTRRLFRSVRAAELTLNGVTK